jgi:thioredoxin-like negative regulator of GroEL
LWIKEMQKITQQQDLDTLQSTGALLILFGAPPCSVCQSLKHKLNEILPQQFPKLKSAYVDCQATPEISAQHGVFSLPVLKVYMDGQLVLEQAGVFSLQQALLQLSRLYQLWDES